MRLDSLALRDYRGITNLDLPLDETLTVIVGVNGIGKTSILHAIAMSLSGFRSLWPNEVGELKINLTPTNTSDIALGKDDFTIKTSVSIEIDSNESRSLNLQLGGNNRTNRRSVNQLFRNETNQNERSFGNEPLFV